MQYLGLVWHLGRKINLRGRRLHKEGITLWQLRRRPRRRLLRRKSGNSSWARHWASLNFCPTSTNWASANCSSRGPFTLRRPSPCSIPAPTTGRRSQFNLCGPYASIAGEPRTSGTLRCKASRERHHTSESARAPATGYFDFCPTPAHRKTTQSSLGRLRIGIRVREPPSSDDC
jgi:hypothetical protein